MANREFYEGLKSPFNFEVMDSGDETKYAKALDSNDQVVAWTKSHKIVIRYRNKKGTIAKYYPDFLVRRKNQNELELVEIKGAYLKDDPNVELKRKAAQDWCFQRGMKYQLIIIG